jgi:hypothetical protein
LENRPPPPLSTCTRMVSANLGWIDLRCRACARLPTSRQIAYLTGRSPVARRAILSVPRTRPGRLPEADRRISMSHQMPYGKKRERRPLSASRCWTPSGTAAALSRVTERAVEGSDAQRATAAQRMRRCRARRTAGLIRVSVDLTPAGVADLITAGFLPAASREDAKVVRKAFVRAAVAGGLAADN